MFVWVSIEGSLPEPAGLRNEGEKRVVYTLGCPDPFYPDEPGSKCKVLCAMETPEQIVSTPIEEPPEAVKPKKAAKTKKKTTGTHSYMGWGRDT